MKYLQTTFVIILAAFLSISCSQNALDMGEDINLTNASELSKEELSTALKTVIVNYPVTAVNDDETTEEVNSDEQLGKIISRNTRPKIEFPFDITIDGEIYTIEGINDLREILKRPKKNRPPFRLVFPITVINLDDTTTVIEDQETFKAYQQSLEEGIKPNFQFPISVEDKDGNITEIENEEAFKAYMNSIRAEHMEERRPPFKLVFPVTVINADDTTTLIENEETFKTYRETLEEGVKPNFQFPISMEDNEGNITEIKSEEDFKEYKEANKPEKRR
ncbi:hypothetical protein QVZ41_04035 [Wenyingzhuangia sp. chi5]|uniref:Lipoprotein n=1 Tax=Wenyingzhuangia gilva TaxID=3057677 RepID=A0ABT8VPW5_9FLAO|nr:hypothetical protein [Wenyingzhuangia sp. chi5]MDO3694020.1 hypothetical protein [Wenyingzhuangia sp. chi5]